MLEKAVVLALAACSFPTATAEPWVERSTPYSCDGVVAGEQTATVDPALIAPWHALVAGDGSTRWAAGVLAQTYRWRAPATLGVEARVRIQHEMLELAQRLRAYPAVQRRVMMHVKAIAPSAAELEALGDGTRPQVHAVLGPALGVVERATATCGTGSLVHVNAHDGLLAFRPLRSDRTRALVSQLVAFDRDGKPHVTPLVSGMELRFGDEVDAAACVVQAKLDGTLEVAALAAVEAHAPFVQRRGDGLGCRSCHNRPNAMNARDLTATEAATIDVARMRQVERLANRLWKTLGDPSAR